MISLSPSNSAAYAATRQLLALIQGKPTSTSSEPLCRHLATLEEGLRLRAPEAQAAAAKAGATGTSVVQALELEARQLGAPTLGAPRTIGGADEAIPQDAFEAACRSAVFRGIDASFKLCNLATAQGRLDALGCGFDGRCPLTLRVLMDGSETLARSHPTLEALRGLKPFVVDYLKYVLTVDPVTGSVPLHLLHHFALTQPDGTPAPLLTHLLKFQVLEANWVDAPYGLLGLKAAEDQVGEGQTINAANHYCQPEILDDLGPFMHTIFVGLGAAATSTLGFTMKTWVERYARHVRRATRLANDAERLSWLRRADRWFRASLELIGVLWKAAVHTSTPSTIGWGYVLPFDCEMAKGMDDAELHLKDMLEHRTHFDWLRPAGKTGNRYRLPLLSSAIISKKRSPEDLKQPSGARKVRRAEAAKSPRTKSRVGSSLGAEVLTNPRYSLQRRARSPTPGPTWPSHTTSFCLWAERFGTRRRKPNTTRCLGAASAGQ